MIKNFKWLLLVSLTFVACTSDDEAVIDQNSSDGLPLTAGTANFSKYVSLGNSLTAGYSDSALFMEGQKGSYPNLLSQQFALVGGGEFRIPYTNDNIGGLLLGGFQIQGPRLYFNGSGPVPVSGTITTEITNTLTGAFNNMGVPGAKSFHLLAPGYGNVAGVSTGQANPYFVRFASSPSATILGDAVAQNPTFFSLWIGNNDVLSYATSGGTGVNQLGNFNPATYGGNDITDPIVFEGAYSALLDGLTANGAEGVVANIPDVTSIPFFSTIPFDAVKGLNVAQVTQLNQLFGGINAALAGAGLPPRFVTLIADDGNPATTTDKNPLLIIDETLPNISTQITSALTPLFGAAGAAFLGNQYGTARHARGTVGDRDYILLTTLGLISPPNNIQAGIPPSLSTFAVRGVTYPLQDAAVLTANESLQVKTATTAYNTSIRALATAKDLAFVDANAIFNLVASVGVSNGGYIINTTFVTGGAFSLDGVHPSPRGYSFIANEFLKAINLRYGSNFKEYDFSDFRIMFPPVL